MTSTYNTSVSMTSTSDTSAAKTSAPDLVGPISGSKVILSDVLENSHTDSPLATFQPSQLVTGQTSESAGDLAVTTSSLLQGGGGGSPRPDISVDGTPTHSDNIASEQISPDMGSVASDPNSVTTNDSDPTIATDAPSDAIKGTSTVLNSSPSDILLESSTVVPSQLPAPGATVPTAQGSGPKEHKVNAPFLQLFVLAAAEDDGNNALLCFTNNSCVSC